MYRDWSDWEDERLEMIGIVREFRKNDESYYEDKYYKEQRKAEKLEKEKKVLQKQFDAMHKMGVECLDTLNAIRSSKAYKVLKWIERLFSYRIKLINKTDNLK
jgi:hypothetical protein